jgi:hypothetical protein
MERLRRGASPLHTVAGPANWPDSVWPIGERGILQTLSGESLRLVPSTPQASWGSATPLRYRCFVSLSIQPFLVLGGTRPVCDYLRTLNHCRSLGKTSGGHCRAGHLRCSLRRTARRGSGTRLLEVCQPLGTRALLANHVLKYVRRFW